MKYKLKKTVSHQAKRRSFSKLRTRYLRFKISCCKIMRWHLPSWMSHFPILRSHQHYNRISNTNNQLATAAPAPTTWSITWLPRMNLARTLKFQISSRKGKKSRKDLQRNNWLKQNQMIYVNRSLKKLLRRLIWINWMYNLRLQARTLIRMR